MKPYTTNMELRGNIILPYHFEGAGIGYDNIDSVLIGASILGYSLPRSQTLGCSWELRFYLSNGLLVDFSSTPKSVGGWQELGRLNMKFSDAKAPGAVQDNEIYLYSEISPFRIDQVKSLVFSDEDVFCESGVIFSSSNDQDVVVCAGVPPGSVSASIPFIESDFDPEMEVTEYIEIPIGELEKVKCKIRN